MEMADSCEREQVEAVSSLTRDAFGLRGWIPGVEVRLQSAQLVEPKKFAFGSRCRDGAMRRC